MPRSFLACTLAATLAVLPWHGAAAQACSRQSPAHTIALLELYTSEGCSSCPPADRFVAGLRSAGFDDSAVVPLALHVDYWDYIGWKDRFADPAFSARQRALAGFVGSRLIYTPEIFVAGRELRDWRGGLAAAVRHVNQEPARARIGITLGRPGAAGVPVAVRAQAPRGSTLFVALYQGGLRSEVRAGENGGALLHHDYVVRDWVGPLAADANGSAVLQQALLLPQGADARTLGVAAFVQDAGGKVLQALALPLCSA